MSLKELKSQKIDLSNRGEAVQEIIYSTANQYGGAYPIVKALKGKNLNNLSDKEIIYAIQDSKLQNYKINFRSSSSQWSGIKSRIKSRIEREKKEALELLELNELEVKYEELL